MAKARIVVIDYNQDTCIFLQNILSDDYQVIFCNHPLVLLETVRNGNADLALIDEDLPELNGIECIRHIRSDQTTKLIPLFFLSSHAQIPTIIEAFHAGADDFIHKPFDYNELLARIQSKLNLFQRFQDNPKTINIGALKIILDTRDVFFQQKKLTLTQIEFDLLSILALKSPSFLSREIIQEKCWGPSSTKHKNRISTRSRTIDVHIRSLRKKIPGLKDNIKSLYGKGYAIIP